MRLHLLALLPLIACDAERTDPVEVEVPLTCERAELSLARDATIWTEVETFDDHGRRLRTVRSAIDAERADDHAIDYRYDAAGHLVEESHDDEDNGTVDWTVTWTYDAAGRWTVMRSTWSVWSKIHERTFDAAGDLVAERVDDFSDGRMDLVATQSFADGKVVERLEETFTIPPLKNRVFHYDDAGRLVRIDEDLGADGTIDGLTTWEFDAAGKLRVNASLTADGTWIEGATATRDAAGFVTSVVWDSTLDGLETYTYVNDPYGNVLTRDVAHGRDGAPASLRNTYTSGCGERGWD